MDIHKLAEILLQMRHASHEVRSINTEEALRNLMHNYDMLFLGKNFNEINSLELCHCLKTKFDFDIDIDDLNDAIPEICKSLGMKFEPLINVKDVGKPNAPITAYSITLY
jgi:hypothetical protein